MKPSAITSTLSQFTPKIHTYDSMFFLYRGENEYYNFFYLEIRFIFVTTKKVDTYCKFFVTKSFEMH